MIGENCLHMAIVNENLAMVHFLCKNGINIHDRAYGAFFCPEDQRDDRDDHENLETIILSEDTNYQRYLLLYLDINTFRKNGEEVDEQKMGIKGFVSL